MRGAGLGPTLESVKKAHINSKLLPGTLDSYRKDACVFLGANLLAGRIQKDCIKGSLGILMPSSAVPDGCGGKGENLRAG
jgi:hypothetical protein